MKGFMTITVTENGYGVDMDLHDVSTQNKLELMHTVATCLHMDPPEIGMFCTFEQLGFFEDAAEVSHCATVEELEQLLQGGKK